MFHTSLYVAFLTCQHLRGWMPLSRVAVFSLGGTIAMMPRAGEEGVRPALSVEDLLESLPELKQITEVYPVNFRQLPSAHLTMGDIIQLAQAIHDLKPAGAVIVQGTDTIEETAFALDQLVQADIPVVVTGAMRNGAVPGADGRANLLSAIQVAADRQSLDLGTLVVMNDQIHAARFVQKVHTSNIAAFISSNGPPLGWVTESVVNIVVRVERGPLISVQDLVHEACVALLTMSLGDDGRILSRLTDMGYAGVVVAGMGGGHVPPFVADRLAEIAQDIPVVLASRTGSGPALKRTYNYSGSEMDLRDKGAINAGWLDPLKARILLSLKLQSGADIDQARQAFEFWGGG